MMIKSSNILLLLPVLSVVLFSATANAGRNYVPMMSEEDSSSVIAPDTTRVLDESIVIDVRRQDRFLETIPSQLLKGPELEHLNSFSVADALRYFSGVQLKDYGGIGGLKTVNIRSMGTNHVGVFYDGIQLGNAQNGQVDLGRFSLDDVDEISLHNGQKSDIFQSAKDFGTSGSIYIRTHIPKFAGDKRFNLKAAV